MGEHARSLKYMKVTRRFSLIVGLALVLTASILALLALDGWLPGQNLHSTTSSNPPAMSSSQMIRIRLGESQADFLTRFADRVQINSQPAGLDFLSIDWRRPPYATVTLDQPHAAFSVDHVLGVQTFRRASDGARQGLTRFSIYAGVNEGGDVLHDKARIYIHELLKRILSAGWGQMVDVDEPRLAGVERLKRTLATSNLNGLDARHVVPLKEWMQIEDGTPWNFVRDDAVLQVTFRRDAAKLEAASPGAYFLSLTWMSTSDHFREMVDPDERAHWRELLPAILVKAGQSRTSKEDELRKAGWTIDTSYVDPAPQALQR